MVDTTSGVRQRAGLRRVLVVLCTTQITSWGVLFYALPVLTRDIAVHTGWSATAVVAAFSAAQVVSALAGVPLGRVLDRLGPRHVMTGGSVLAVPALVGVATARDLFWFTAAWLLAGVAMAGTLYQPAFAALTRWYGPRRVSALTTVTLVGGLASTVFAPLTATLAAHMDWRAVYLVLAGVLAVITIPLHLWGLRLPWPPATVEPEHHGHQPDAVARSRPFIALVVAMSLAALAVYAVVVNLVPLLTERGLSTSTAAWALGLSGAGQVLGRLGYSRLVAATSVRGRTTLILLAGSATTGALGAIPGPAAVLVAVGVLAGVARGAFTLLQATAVSDRWGSAHYGRLSGLVSAPVSLTAAVAPWVGAALAGLFGGYPLVFGLLAGCGVLAAVVAGASIPRRGKKVAKISLNLEP